MLLHNANTVDTPEDDEDGEGGEKARDDDASETACIKTIAQERLIEDGRPVLVHVLSFTHTYIQIYTHTVKFTHIHTYTYTDTHTYPYNNIHTETPLSI